MVEIRAFDHLSLSCRKAKETQHFYEKVLGFRMTSHMPQWGMTELTAGGAAIVIVDAESREGAWANSPRGIGENVHHFCLRLSSFDEGELRNLLSQHKVAIEEEQREQTSKGAEHAFYIRDPEGNCIELRGLVAKKKPTHVKNA